VLYFAITKCTFLYFVAFFTRLTSQFHASSPPSRMAFHLRRVAQLQLSLQVLVAPSLAAVSKSGIDPTLYHFGHFFAHCFVQGRSLERQHEAEPGIVLGALCFMSVFDRCTIHLLTCFSALKSSTFPRVPRWQPACRVAKRQYGCRPRLIHPMRCRWRLHPCLKCNVQNPSQACACLTL